MILGELSLTLSFSDSQIPSHLTLVKLAIKNDPNQWASPVSAQ